MSPWHNKVVLVTGGSRGLGWHLGHAFAQRGAHVVLVARDASMLADAQHRMGAHAQRVTTQAADITVPQSAAQIVEQVQSKHGRLDALVHCAGRSARGRVSETTAEQFQALWELNFLALVRCTRAALPLLRQSHGHLVHIGSLASRSPGRFLGAYPVTKYAVGAYAHQLRMELKHEGVHVLLVCPGPIRREDSGQRYHDQLDGLPPEAAAPGGGARLRGLDPDRLAQRIIRACEHRQTELVIPARARLLFAIAQLFPRLGDWLLERFTGQRDSSLRDSNTPSA